MIIQKTLNNGIRVIVEKMENVRSCSIGIWVGTGSAFELSGEEGASHFIEHMLFKGTDTRSAKDIAAQMDSIGGNINAFTSKECTCYYAKVLDEHLETAVDILADIFLNSKFDKDEIKKEQGVVCEEILMVEDTPEDLAHDTVAKLYYLDDPLAKPILGTEESVRSFTRAALKKYIKRQYVPSQVVIAAAGNINEERFIDLANEKFSQMQGGSALPMTDNKAPGGKRYMGVEKDVEQVHMCMTLPGTALDTKSQYPLYVLSNILGGSMSSRLFQKIREQRGLAYSIYTYPSCYRTVGSFSIYAGTGVSQAAQMMELILQELELLKTKGVTELEFNRSKEQLKGNFILGQEGTGSRMNSLGKTALLLNRVYDEAETLRKIEGVSMSDVDGIIPLVIDESQMVTACVGRVKEHQEQFNELLHLQ